MIKVRTRLASALALATVLIGLLLAPAMAQGSASDFAQVDAYIEELRATSNVPGMALAIVRDGEIVYERGYGDADAQGRPLTPETPMLIGSVSKSFTALAIMQLVEAGKLELDAPVSHYLPWFERPETITVRHLLTQTSGYSTLEGRQDFSRPADDPQAFEKVARRMANAPLASPGAQPGVCYPALVWRPAYRYAIVFDYCGPLSTRYRHPAEPAHWACAPLGTGAYALVRQAAAARFLSK